MFSWMDQAKQIFSAEKAAPRFGWLEERGGSTPVFLSHRGTWFVVMEVFCWVFTWSYPTQSVAFFLLLHLKTIERSETPSECCCGLRKPWIIKRVTTGCWHLWWCFYDWNRPAFAKNTQRLQRSLRSGRVDPFAASFSCSFGWHDDPTDAVCGWVNEPWCRTE